MMTQVSVHLYFLTYEIVFTIFFSLALQSVTYVPMQMGPNIHFA
jgi:hypothetical protein